MPCLTIDLRPVRRTLHLTLHDRGYDARASALALLGRFCSDSHPLHSCRVTELALAAVSATTHEAHAALQELLAAREALWTRSSHGSSTPSRLSLASTLAQELVRLKEQLVRVRLKVKPAAVRLEVKPADWCKQQEEIAEDAPELALLTPTTEESPHSWSRPPTRVEVLSKPVNDERQAVGIPCTTPATDEVEAKRRRLWS